MVCFNFDWIFADLKQYKRENGNLSISTCHPLFLTILDEFISLGMDGLLRKRWDDQFADLRAFTEQYEDCMVAPTHPTLGSWARIQCDHYRLYSQRHPSPLTKERFQLLKSIGFDELVKCEEVEAHKNNGNRGTTATKDSPEDRRRKKKGGSRVTFGSLSPPPAAQKGRSQLVRQLEERKLVNKDRPRHNKKRDSVLKSSAPPRLRTSRRPMIKMHSKLARKRNASSIPPRLPEETESKTKKVYNDDEKAIKSLEARLKKNMNSESSKGPAAAPKKPSTHPRSPSTPTETMVSLEARLKENMSSESSKGPAVAPKKPSTHPRSPSTPIGAIESFEARLKKKMSCESSKGPAVAPKKPSTQPRSASTPIGAIESFEARLKKKMSSESSKGPATAPKKQSTCPHTASVPAEGNNGSSQHQKLMTRIISFEERLVAKTSSDESTKATKIMPFEERLMASSDDSTRASTSSDESTRASSIPLESPSPSPNSLKKSLAPDQLFLEDDIDDGYISWSELEEALTRATGQSLHENARTVLGVNRG